MVRSAVMHGMPAGKNLLAVARAGAGTNNIPSAEYAEKGIVVFNTPGANANAVKELVICELFLGGRNVIDAIDWVKSIKDEGENLPKLVEKGKNKFVGCEIAGKTLGVIGLGAIGVMVANSASSLGMKVAGVDPYLSTPNAVALTSSAKLVSSREEIYRTADFITLHVPLNNETKNMINGDTIAKMKDGVVIINNSRGSLSIQTRCYPRLKAERSQGISPTSPTQSLWESRTRYASPISAQARPKPKITAPLWRQTSLPTTSKTET